ncbi:hypothetical protein PENTCL1PPCAC_10235, partial [Pristionchus entomophagus]
MENQSYFEKLPRELVWEIFEYTPSSVFELRQTSSVLRSLVDEFAMQRSTIVLVQEVRFFQETDHITIALFIPKHTSSLFELRLKLRRPACRVNVRVTRVNHLYHSAILQIYDVKLRDHSEITRVFAHLKVCMGKRIVEVRLSECTDDNTLNTVDELFNGIQFRQLAVSCQTLSD